MWIFYPSFLPFFSKEKVLSFVTSITSKTSLSTECLTVAFIAHSKKYPEKYDCTNLLAVVKK